MEQRDNVCQSILRKMCAHCTCKRCKTSTAVQSVVFISLDIAHEISVCRAQYILLSSTQSAVASRDANIRQLEEKCEQLEAQVSLAICVFCETYTG